MKKRNFIRILCFAIIILLLTGGFALYYYKTHYISVSYTKRSQKEITDTLNRPECGWFQLYSYYLRPDTDLTADELYYEKTDSSGYEYRLSLVEFNLAEYASSSLDISAVKNIQTVFKQFQKTRSKLIVRFLYDWDGMGREKEPRERKTIMNHMKVVAPLINEYQDIIYTTQGIFVGSWAEMHDSAYLSKENMTTLLLQFASLTDDSIYLAVRTPEQYRMILKELEQQENKYRKYNITKKQLKKRLGLFNDGMLGSLSDLGTYQEVDDMTISKEKRLALRKKALDFQEKLCLTVPNGGEVIQNRDTELLQTKSAIQTLRQMHVSYLNQTYDEKVIKRWKKAKYQNAQSPFNGVTTYDYITAHLGARPVLRNSSLQYTPFQKGDATGTITIENTGFSNYYHKKSFTILLKDKKTNKEILLQTYDKDKNVNPMNWNSNDTYTISYHFSPFSLEDGDYALLVRLSDPVTKEEIPFANDSYNKAKEGYVLGTVHIQR